MTTKIKAASPIQASTQGETASNSIHCKNTSEPAFCQSAAAQRQRILAWLRNNSLTTLEARQSLDILHPAARVMELRRQGHTIKTVWTDELSDAGGRHRIARYILQKSKEVAG